MDWAELNPDLLRHIAIKVRNINDFIRLRAVCASWRLAVLPSDLPPQLPFFIHFRKNAGSEDDLEIVCPFAERTRSLFSSKANKYSILLGSSTQYVLLADCSSSFASIINPFTGLRMPVPFQGEYLLYYVFIGPHSSPTGNGIDVVVCLIRKLEDYNLINLACVWRYDCSKWLKIIETPYNTDEEVFYNNGRLYFFSNDTRETRVIDVNREGLDYVVPNSSVAFDCLIEAFGNLIGVKRLFDPDENTVPIEEYAFEVYWLDNTGNIPSWSKMNNGIGNWIMFLDYYSNFCLKADDFDGLKGNSIYFTTTSSHDDRYIEFLVRYDMEMHLSQVLCKYDMYQGGGKWFTPSLHEALWSPE